MNPDLERQRLFTRRAAVLGGVKVVLLSTLFGRLYYLQVMESDRYTMLAEENRINVRLLAPPRGLIVDRNGTPLVKNRQDYRAMVVEPRVADAECRHGTLTIGQLLSTAFPSRMPGNSMHVYDYSLFYANVRNSEYSLRKPYREWRSASSDKASMTAVSSLGAGS